METVQSTAELVESSRPAHLLQYITTLSVTMGGLSFGAAVGYTSSASPLLMNNGTDGSLSITENQNMWFSSTLTLGALIGGPVGGLLISAFGRKGTMLGCVLLSLAGWLLIALAQNFAMLVSGRIFGGLFTGIICITVPTYLGEVTSTDIRGKLGSAFQLMVVTGVLYAYLLGAVVPGWRGLAWVCAAPTVLYAVLVFFVKESPTFLIAKGKHDQARAALQALRGENYNIEAELNWLQESQERLSRNSVSLRDLKQAYIIKPAVILIVIMFFQQASGINAVVFNLNQIFTDTGIELSESTNSIIVGTVHVLATAVSGAVVDRAGRKVLLTVSAAIMTLSLVALDVFFYQKAQDEEKALDTLGWLPLVSLMVYIIAFAIGYGPVPWVMMGELFALEMRATASGLATMANWTTAFLATFLFEPMQSVMKDFGVYWFFGGICALNVVFCLLVVPETKGKTVQEVIERFGAPATTLEEKPPAEERKAEAAL